MKEKLLAAETLQKPRGSEESTDDHGTAVPGLLWHPVDYIFSDNNHDFEDSQTATTTPTAAAAAAASTTTVTGCCYSYNEDCSTAPTRASSDHFLTE